VENNTDPKFQFLGRVLICLLLSVLMTVSFAVILVFSWSSNALANPVLFGTVLLVSWAVLLAIWEWARYRPKAK
jgi:ABC-type Mn2+/Zn2+ transport system permease subunit